MKRVIYYLSYFNYQQILEHLDNLEHYNSITPFYDSEISIIIVGTVQFYKLKIILYDSI